MADLTDGALVDAILNANIESFEFDNGALDSIEELLSGINESDLCEAVSMLPLSGTYTDGSSEYHNQSYLPHDVITSSLSSTSSSALPPPCVVPPYPTSSKDARHSIRQMEYHPNRQIASATERNSAFQRSLPSTVTGYKSGNRGISDSFSPPVLPSTAGMGVELQTFVENYGERKMMDILKMEQPGSLHGRGCPQTPTTVHQRPLHHIPFTSQQQQPNRPLPPSDMHSFGRRLSGTQGVVCPQNRVMDIGDLCPNGYASTDMVSVTMDSPMTNNVLENFFSDRKEMDRILSQIAINDDQLQQVLTNPNKPYSSTANVAVQNTGDKACSSFPDTPPESGSEAHSPPDNIQLMSSETSSQDLRSDSFSKVLIAPGSQGTLPSYHQVSGNHAVQHPGYLKASPTNFTQTALAPLDPQLLLTEYNRGSLSHKSKKRKHSISPQNSVNSSIVNALAINTISANLPPLKPVALPINMPIKPEPVVSDGSEDDTCGYENQTDANNGSYQVIKWANHMTSEWAVLIDESGRDSSVTTYRVDADKGFTFSAHDEAFVCQKKNHFQVTIHIAFSSFPAFIRSMEEGLLKIDDFFLNFHGIKMESPNQQIKIEQSQSDRSKRPLHPVRVEFGSPSQSTTKAVIGRLHFSETTTNNMRKRGKPNPDQRYFQLVVSLVACCGTRDLLVAAQVSERIIVRASNPGQFDGDVDSPWNKGKVPDAIFHTGNVGINIENPDEALTVHGNIKLTGHVVAPSDIRAKTDLKQLDTSQQLKNIAKINVYHYRYNEKFAQYAGLNPNQETDTGVLAQEVSRVLPDAVQQVGDVVLADGETIENFLVVNKDRIFIEGIGAVKELCKVTDKLEDRINEIEIMSKHLKKHGHNRDSIKSTRSTRSDVSSCSCVSQPDNSRSPTSPKKPSSGGLSTHQSTHHSHHNRHRHDSHHGHSRNPEEISNKEEKGLCSNRVIQVVIVILVLIMALCLAAIATWFILKDNLMTSDVLNVNPTPPIDGGNFTSVNTTTVPYGTDWTETAQTLPGTSYPNPNSDAEPLIWPECLLNDCPIMQCCIGETIDVDDFLDTTTGIQQESSSSSSSLSDEFTLPPLDESNQPPSSLSSSTRQPLRAVPFGVLPATTKSPLSSDSSHSSTSGFVGPMERNQRAGPAGPTDPTTTTSGGPTDANDDYIGDIAGTGPQEYEAPDLIHDPGYNNGRSKFYWINRRRGRSNSTSQQPSMSPDSVSFSSTVRGRKFMGRSSPGTSRTTTKADIAYGSTAVAYPKYSIVNQNKSLSPDVRVILGNQDPIYRKRRLTSLPTPPLADIVVKLNNDTRNVTTSYCVNDNCKLQTGDQLIYEIPLSPTFPQVSVQLQFIINSEDFYPVDLCNSSFVKNCNSTDEAAYLIEESFNEWLLPVGMFYQSTFIFRVPSATDEVSNSTCLEPEANAGTTYREYTLTFMRQCNIQD